MFQGIEISEKLLGSETRLEILALFRENPGLMEGIDTVGRSIGRDTREIETEVRELVNIGVLRSKTIENSEIIYMDGQKVAQIQKEISTQLIRKE
ncbi:MAG TPA: hypothetical protein VLV18_03160 [Terriglobales bacterium]|nr:hypothetical protein [Terriglobales bacterium]